MIRKIIAISILVVAILVGAAGIRWFPFSDYPMFSRAIMQPEACALFIRDSQGKESLVPSYAVSPFNRLHIHQMCMKSFYSKEKDFSWIRFFGKRYKKKESDIQAVMLKKTHFLPDKNTSFSVLEEKTRTVYEINL